MAEFGAEFCARGLPSAPRRMIVVHDDPFRPQPRLDRDADGGMTTTVGRLRLDGGRACGTCWSRTTPRWAPPRAPCSTAEHMVDAGTI